MLRFAALLAWSLLLTPLAHAEDAPVFSGYLTSAPGKVPLTVDGRTLLLSPKTVYACGSLSPRVEIEDGKPALPPGARLQVTGVWSKASSAWRTESLCVAALPAKSCGGQGVIDVVRSQADFTELLVDGRHLRLPAAGKTPALIVEASAAGPSPQVGQWLQYEADRQPDGSWLLRSGRLRAYLDSRAARRLRDWKPLTLELPINGKDGKFRASRLALAIPLSGDLALEDRIARIGASVVPSWEAAFAAKYPDERRFRFFAAKAKLFDRDCVSFPDGTILLPQKLEAELSEDAELAAVLAGCVADIEEEQAAVYANKELAANTVEAAGFFELGVPAGLAGNVYQAHLKLLMERQSARVALSYLEMAGYAPKGGPSAWEKLEGKHGQVDPSRPPGTRTAMMYEALSESPPQPGPATVLK